MPTVADPTTALGNPMAPTPFRVMEVRRELADTFTIELEPPDGPFPFDAGQFTMLYVFGIGEAPISISGDPGRPGTLVHTVRSVGRVTEALCRAQVDDFLGVRGPYGRPWPLADAKGRDLVIVAGGIGLAPLRPVVYHIFNHRDDFGRVAILYGARTAADLLYPDEVREWRGRFDATLLLTVDQADRGWHGSVGVVTNLIPRAPFNPENTTAFVCGPEIMMRFSAQELIDRGVSADQIFLSLERNMQCGIGICGHCQFGPHMVCCEGPVMGFAGIEKLLRLREV